MEIRKIIMEIKKIVRTRGFIYALCMIIFEDFHFNLEEIGEVDIESRLSEKEVALLLGFLIQDKIDFSKPETPQELILLKKEIYEVMKKLHESFIVVYPKKLQKSLEKEWEDFRKEQKEFFGKGDMLIEPIFYSGTGAYDFQYLEFLEQKYKYDRSWLMKRNFDIENVKEIIKQIKKVLQEKAQKVHLYNLRERLPQIFEDIEKKYINGIPKEDIEELLPIIELYQYAELFYNNENDPEFKAIKQNEDRWESFYQGLIDLFTIKKTDFKKALKIDLFLKNFSIVAQKNLNNQFESIGSFNQFNAKPIIQLDGERFFVPSSFALAEAVYESPFYWMLKEDENYRNISSQNRGKVGEEMVYNLLLPIFGKDKIFKAIKIRTLKGKDDTDVDVLCVLWSKALCIQVKSKKLTELSRSGDDNQLQKDFKAAIQDAYDQGILSRKKILEKTAKFYDQNNQEIRLSEAIEEVYIMGVTTENYPSLTLQSYIMLDKKDKDPFPIFLTIFDLDLICYYLRDPYDFLYYIKQRTDFMDYFKADEELIFLGYHLSQKLSKIPEVDRFYIDRKFGQIIDRNYYPIKMGLRVSDQWDFIKNRWRNEKFEQLCNELKAFNQPKITDIIFHLLDFSGSARKNIVDLIIQTKQKTLWDNKSHNFSVPPDDRYEPRIWLTYISINSNNINQVKKELVNLSIARKYKSKGDIWIGFGSIKHSTHMIDVVILHDNQRRFDKNLEELSKLMLEWRWQGQIIRLSPK